VIAAGPCSTTVESDLPSRYLAASSSPRATAIANDEVYRLVMNVATGQDEVGESAKELRRLATQ